MACVGEERPLAYQGTLIPEDFVLNVVVPETSASLDAAVASGNRLRARLACQEQSVHLRRAAALAESFSRPRNGDPTELHTALPPICEKVVPGLEQALKVRNPGLLAVFVCGSVAAVREASCGMVFERVWRSSGLAMRARATGTPSIPK